MNRALFFVILMVMVKLTSAQDYIVRGVTPDLYLTHPVAAKETWYSIARAYNLNPNQIAAFNKLTIDKTLEIGQELRIPLTSSNFTQSDAKAADEKLVPVYHIIQEKEWMYRISVNHNKVPIERLERWNSISSDEAKAGMKLIVGHLKVKQENASTAAKTPAETQSQTSSTPAVQSRQSPAQPNTTGTTTANTGTVAAANKGGYFMSQYRSTGKSQSGVAGVFKSTSGWNDGKYYALMNNVTVGTIIKIVFPQTNKTVYAKVLGELPDMKESAGLALRISDAAASELGAVNGKFSVNVAH